MYIFRGFRSFLEELLLKPFLTRGLRVAQGTSYYVRYANVSLRCRDFPNYCTGHPGSRIVPQYGSSKITVFVWGKNTILKFLRNTT